MLQEVQLTTGLYPYVLLTDACAAYFSMLYRILLVNVQVLRSSGRTDFTILDPIQDGHGDSAISVMLVGCSMT